MLLLDIQSSPRGARSASIAVSNAFLDAYQALHSDATTTLAFSSAPTYHSSIVAGVYFSPALTIGSGSCFVRVRSRTCSRDTRRLPTQSRPSRCRSCVAASSPAFPNEHADGFGSSGLMQRFHRERRFFGIPKLGEIAFGAKMPYTATALSEVGTYTLPLATVGGTNLVTGAI
jgi:hypothetical protein